jgi:hypothetical protein
MVKKELEIKKVQAIVKGRPALSSPCIRFVLTTVSLLRGCKDEVFFGSKKFF